MKKTYSIPPTNGLAILTKYNMYTKIGEYKIIDIATKKVIAIQPFKGRSMSDNIIGLLGICEACEYAIAHDFIDKIYCSNQIPCIWATSKRFKSKVSSPDIIEMVNEKMKILDAYDFSETITYWDSGWGGMKSYLNGSDYDGPSDI